MCNTVFKVMCIVTKTSPVLSQPGQAAWCLQKDSLVHFKDSPIRLMNMFKIAR